METLDILEEYPWPRCEISTRSCLGEAFLCLGKWQEAIDQFELALELASKFGIAYDVTWIHYYRSLIFEMNDDLDDAYTEALLANDFAINYGYEYLRGLTESWLTHISLKMNRIKEAEKHCLEADRISKLPNLNTRSPLYGIINFAKAEFYLKSGEKETAHGIMDNALKELHDVQFGMFYTALFCYRFSEMEYALGYQPDDQIFLQNSLAIFNQIENHPMVYSIENKIGKTSVNHV
jgi:tetratricopeptide (TPR) repeat protein